MPNERYYDFVINIFHDVKHWRRCTNLADFMAKDGYKVLIVTNSRDAFRTVKEHSSHEVVNVKELAKSLPVSDDLDVEWRAMAARFGVKQSLYRFVEIEAVQNLPSYPSKTELLLYTVRLFKAYEALFRNVEVKYFFQLLASDIERRAFFLAGKRFARYSIQYTQSVIPDQETFFVGEDGAADPVFVDEMSALTHPSAELAEQIKATMKERKRAGKYLARRQWSLMDSITGIRAIKERLLGAKMSEYFKRSLIRFLLVPLRKQLWRIASTRFEPGEKYVFYPMHAPGEDTVIVRGFPHLDEVTLVKVIAMSLPAGYKLYVKEHPGWEGWHTLCELNRLRGIEEVRLVESTTNSHAVIEHATACVVLNSSVWFESLMLNKPVICLGTGVFTGLGVVNEVYDLRVLDVELARLVDTTPDRQGLDRFLNVMWNLSYEGIYHFPHERTDLTYKLYDALIAHLKRLETLFGSDQAQMQISRG